MVNLKCESSFPIPGANSDYESWQAHETGVLGDNMCNLGSKKSFFRRKKGSICVNDQQLVQQKTERPCLCVESDYLW